MPFLTESKQTALPLWQRLGGFGLAFWAGAVASRYFSVPEASYIPFWMPAGIYLAALLLTATRDWLWFMLAALAANLAFDLPLGTPLGAALGLYAANTVEAVICSTKFSSAKYADISTNHAHQTGLTGFDPL
jgi:integral membrane sensor domain MASE1